jgi:hypothetical protein
MGLSVDLDNMEKLKFLTLLGLEHQPLSHLTLSQFLYQLHCRGSVIMTAGDGIYHVNTKMYVQYS